MRNNSMKINRDWLVIDDICVMELDIPLAESCAQETDEGRQARIYPVVLSKYNPVWPEWFAEEETNLKRLIGAENIARISHYGSTSVPGLLAIPTVDILLEITETADIENLIAALPSPDYICLSGAGADHADPTAAFDVYKRLSARWLCRKGLPHPCGLPRRPRRVAIQGLPDNPSRYCR